MVNEAPSDLEEFGQEHGPGILRPGGQLNDAVAGHIGGLDRPRNVEHDHGPDNAQRFVGDDVAPVADVGHVGEYGQLIPAAKRSEHVEIRIVCRLEAIFQRPSPRESSFVFSVKRQLSATGRRDGSCRTNAARY